MYELKGRNRTTKRYDKLKTFEDKKQFHYMLDQVDKSKYSEAMILNDSGGVEMYIEIKEPQKVLTKHRYN